MKKKVDPKVLPSEALFMFAAWITTRDEAVSAGSGHECSIWAKLVSEFCEHNGFEEVRADVYPHNMEHPPSKKP